MQNFWDFEAWGGLSLIATLLIGLLIANAMKKNIKFVRKSLIPTPVLGGIILLVITTVYEKITGEIFFNTNFYADNGLAMLEIFTYHCSALSLQRLSVPKTNLPASERQKFSTPALPQYPPILSRVFSVWELPSARHIS